VACGGKATLLLWFVAILVKFHLGSACDARLIDDQGFRDQVVPSPTCRTSSCVFFLIMGIVNVIRMTTTIRVHCYKNKGNEPIQFYDIHEIVSSQVVSDIMLLTYVHIIIP
jgi:hypothetical protein